MALPSSRARRVALPFVGAAVIALLAGCSSTPADSTPPASDAADGFGGVELTVWNNIDFDPYQSLQKGYFEKCAADLDIDVDVETLSGEYTTSLLQAASSKSLPDIALMNTDTQLPQLAAQGVLADLGELGLTTDGLDDAVASLGKYEDTLYGLPTQVENYVLFYDQAAFEAAGITEVPTTFDELIETAKAVTTDDQYGIALPGIAGDGSTASYFLPFLLSAGGDPTEVTSDAAVATVELYQQLVADGSLSKEFVNWGWESIDQWTSGKAAITLSGPWNLVDSSIDIDYATFPVPTAEAGESTKVGVVGYAYAAAVQSDQNRQKAAAALIECRAAEANQIDTAVQGGYVPALSAAQEAFVEQVPAAESFVTTLPESFNPATLGTEWNTLQQQYVDALQDATVNGVTAEDALAKAAQG